MGDFGISYYREGYRFFQVPGGQDYQPRDYAIEADASSASYFWAAAAITGGRVHHHQSLPWSPARATPPSRRCWRRWAVPWWSEPAGLTVKGGPLTGIRVDLAAMPDLVPTLAVVAAFAQGDTVITGVAHLRHKESDRLAAVAAELRKMGIGVQETADGLIIHGGSPRGAIIDTYEDHRLAMSFAVAGLKAPGTVIKDPEVVAKSFPDFWEFFERLYS